MCPGLGCFPYVDMEIEGLPKTTRMNGPPQGWTARGGYYGANCPQTYYHTAFPTYKYQPSMLWYSSPRDFAERALYPSHPPSPFSPHNSNPRPWLYHPHSWWPTYTSFHQAHFYNPYQPPTHPSNYVSGVRLPPPHVERKDNSLREQTFRYIPAGACPTAAVTGKVPWNGRTRAQVEVDDAHVAAHTGMNEEHDFEPKDANSNQEFWCWESTEQCWSRRSFDTIKNALQPGKWRNHPAGFLYFERQTSQS